MHILHKSQENIDINDNGIKGVRVRHS